MTTLGKEMGNVMVAVQVAKVFFEAREENANDANRIDAALLATLAEMVANGDAEIAVMVLDMLGKPEVSSVENATEEKEPNISEGLATLLKTIFNE